MAPPPPPRPPPRTDLAVASARALRAEGNVPGARAELEAALRESPAAEDLRLELAELLVADGQELARAAELVAGLDAEGAQGRRVHLVRARLAEARSDDDAAAAEYGAALATGDDPEVRLRRGLALERLGRSGEAISELELVRAARPGDAVARARLAERYEAARRIEEAETEYRWLAEAQPDRAFGWERLAEFYERVGRPAQARAAAERARALGARPDRGLRPLRPSTR